MVWYKGLRGFGTIVAHAAFGGGGGGGGGASWIRDL